MHTFDYRLNVNSQNVSLFFPVHSYVSLQKKIGKINVSIVSEIMGPVTTYIRVKKLTGWQSKLRRTKKRFPTAHKKSNFAKKKVFQKSIKK